MFVTNNEISEAWDSIKEADDFKQSVNFSNEEERNNDDIDNEFDILSFAKGNRRFHPDYYAELQTKDIPALGQQYLD